LVSAGPNTAGGAAPGRAPLSRGALYAAVPLLAIAATAALLLGGGGAGGRHAGAATAARRAGAAAPAVRVRGGAAGVAGGRAGRRAGGRADGRVAGGRVAVAEVRDPEEAKSFPLPASTRHANASTPAAAGETVLAAGAASDAQIRKELGEEERATARERAGRAGANSDLSAVPGGFSVGGNGTIPIPRSAPEAVQRVIAGGNAIADFPYIWGGGHASFVANGYDCSGSVSYALAAGGLLAAPLVSGELAQWGEPGPGRWITIYANAGHTFMDVDGWWFDTAGRSGPYASRWLVSTPPLEGYAVRHPPGY
jgi:cell wall-associated NlpC family hydrolase